METDLQATRNLLARFGIVNYKFHSYNNGHFGIEIEAKVTDQVIGYSGFTTTFVFDHNEKFKNIDIGE